MAITVERGLDRRLRETVLLLVRSGDLPDRVATGLRAAGDGLMHTGLLLGTGEEVVDGEVIAADGTQRRPDEQEWESNQDLDELEGPAYVSEPVAVPAGQLLMIDFASTPARLCRLAPQILSRHLTEAGVRDAEIGLAPKASAARQRSFRLYTPVARALLLGAPSGPPGSGPPALDLIDLAEQWLRGQQQPGTELLMKVISAEVPLTWDSLRPAVDAAVPGATYLPVIAATPGTQLASVVLGTFFGSGVSLNVAGKNWSFRQLATRMRSLSGTLRTRAAELPDLTWAGVTASAESLDLYMPGSTAWTEDDVGPVWYQLLSAAQLDRLGGPPSGASEVADGRYELTIGEPEQWVPGHPSGDAIRAQARKLLRTG